MACGGCAKKAAERSSPAPLSRGIGPDAGPDSGIPAGMVEVSYRGTVGNHFVYSPTQRVNGQRLRYGYFSRGDLIVVYAEDVDARPDLFVPVVSVQPEKVERAVFPPALLGDVATDGERAIPWNDDIVDVEAAFPALSPADDFTVLPWVGEKVALFFLEELKVLTFAELAALPLVEIEKAPGLGKKRAAEVKDAAARRA